MRKFLNLTIMLMILFISISTVGCGAKDDYIEGYGEDEYIEYSDSEYYEEPQEAKISDKEIEKILKKYPDYKTKPEDFFLSFFKTDIVRPLDNDFIRRVDNYISKDISYRSIVHYEDPNGMQIYRIDQTNQKEIHIVTIQRYSSVFSLSEEETEYMYPDFNKFFDWVTLNKKFIMRVRYYHIAAMDDRTQDIIAGEYCPNVMGFGFGGDGDNFIKQTLKDKDFHVVTFLKYKGVNDKKPKKIFEKTYHHLPNSKFEFDNENNKFIILYNSINSSSEFFNEEIDEIFKMYVNWTYYNNPPKILKK